jgi:hypothetical protein
MLIYNFDDSFAATWLHGTPEGWTPPSDDEAIDLLTRFVYRGLTGTDY